MLNQLLFQFSLLIACAFAISLTYREGAARMDRGGTRRRLALAGGASLLLALTSIDVGGVRVDLHLVPVAMALLRYGAGAGVAVAAPGLVWHLVLGPGGDVRWMALLDFAGVVLMSTVIRPFAQALLNRVDPRHLWLTPLPFLGVGWGVLLLPNSQELFMASYPLRVLLSALGLNAAFFLLHSRLRLLDLTQFLSAEAHTDALTGLLNRRAFDQDLKALRPGEHLALLDLDHFKAVNDRYGHDGGDRALAQVAGLLRSFAPGAVRGYRVGGEEFAALIVGMEGDQAAERMGELRAALPGQPGGWLAQTGERLTLSIGLATRQADEDSTALFRRADEALYLAKMNGRDRVVVWQPEQGSVARPVLPGRSARLQPRHSAWRALRTTVTLLAQRRVLRGEDWAEMLHLAVEAVDGACCGTLDIRKPGGQFEMVATVGYPHSVVGLLLREESQQRWYGASLDAWQAGTPRVIEGRTLAQAYAASDAELDPAPARILNGISRRHEVKSNLCLPVVLGDQVVAHLNLDSLDGAESFDPGSVEVAQLFAQQVAALLHIQARWDELERLVVLHDRMSMVPSQALVDELTQASADLLAASGATLLRYDRAADALVEDRSAGQSLSRSPITLPRGQGLSWVALDEGAVVRVRDLRQDSRVLCQEFLLPGALMTVPLCASSGEPLGALVLTRALERPFSEADAHLGLLLGSIASRLLERDHHLASLQSTLDAALETLGVAVELRDRETRTHTRRVTELAVTFATHLGLPEEQVCGIRQGALLHDIGKLGVPDAVLRKPGALTATERQTIEAHAECGAALAARIPFLHADAHHIIRAHHERWDGTGYPDRLSGEAIPLAARLFALCDVYDALTSNRPYRSALPVNEALALIAAGEHRQFDPWLARRFLTLHAQGAFAQVTSGVEGALGEPVPVLA